MWVIIGQITWLHANYRHLDHFWPFLGHSGPQIPNLGVPFLANFFSSKYRHVGCPEQCHVMPGLSATFSNARDPLRGSKRPKSHFYGHYRPKIPIFGTSFSANFFFLQNMGMWGVKIDAMWYPVLMQPFQTQGAPSAAQNGQKVNFLAIWTPSLNFLYPGFCPKKMAYQWGFAILAMFWILWYSVYMKQKNEISVKGNKRFIENKYYVSWNQCPQTNTWR